MDDEQRRSARTDYERRYNALRRALPQEIKDELAAKRREHRKNNHQHYAQIAKKSREKNRDKRRAACRDYHHRNKERLNEYRKQWEKENREYSRLQKVKRNYGLEAMEYQQLIEKQNNLCAICHKPETQRDRRSGHLRRLAVDHDHGTGIVRGLLCGACNAALGHLDDDCDRLRSAINYILSYRYKPLKVVANTPQA